MSRLTLVLPAAAMLLAGVVTTSGAQAAPGVAMPEALKVAQDGNVQKAHWWRYHRRHHHHYRHHRRHHHHHYRYHRY